MNFNLRNPFILYFCLVVKFARGHQHFDSMLLLNSSITFMLYYVMLCYVMLCYVMLCYVMLCYVMLCLSDYKRKRKAQCASI